jgi:hypothetical protein
MPPIPQPFTIPYSAEAVADLHHRLDNTRCLQLDRILFQLSKITKELRCL